MKRIVISGYYGLGNSGDEAVLAGAIASFRTLDDEVTLTVLSANPEDTRRQHGVDAVNRYSISDLLKSIARADLVLSGGGSLLQDVTSVRSAAYYLAVVFLAELLGKPVMIYAQGIGPVTHTMTKCNSRFLLNRASLVTVRDEDSAKLLNSLGVTKPHIHVTGDPSFAMEPSEDEEGRRVLAEAGVPADVPLLGVFVRPWKVGSNWMSALAEGLDAAAARTGATPVFIPMQYPDDASTAREIMQRMNAGVVALDRSVNPAVAKCVVGRMSVVVAMRLHALMFAAAQGTPMVALSYDPKVLSFVRSIPGDIPVLDAMSPDPSELAYCIESALLNASAIREATNAKLPEWRREAVRNSLLALGLLHSQHRNGV